jgi:3'(2'), 5'-bisphosphate nucleotidase
MPTPRYLPLTEPLRDALLALCLDAGASIVSHYNDQRLAGKLRDKADDSPLTRADLASHRLLCAGLAQLTPDVPVLSEEGDAASFRRRHEWPVLWMVDPLDGTREFLARTGEFTINIALIVSQQPVLGILYQPLRQRAFIGEVGRGAACWTYGEQGWQARSLHTRRLPARELTVLSSRRHRNARLAATLAFLAEGHAVTRRNAGSALKFCELAAGAGDCYPRFSPCSEWDVAAGHALVVAAGGELWGLDGRPPRYNARRSLLAEPFLAVGDAQAPLWEELRQALEASATDDQHPCAATGAKLS